MSIGNVQRAGANLRRNRSLLRGTLRSRSADRNFTPGNSVFAFPLENEEDFAHFQAFLKSKVPATVPLDISIVVPGDQSRTEN